MAVLGPQPQGSAQLPEGRSKVSLCLPSRAAAAAAQQPLLEAEGEEEAGRVSWAGRRQSQRAPAAEGAAHSSAESFCRWGARRGLAAAAASPGRWRCGRPATGELRASQGAPHSPVLAASAGTAPA